MKRPDLTKLNVLYFLGLLLAIGGCNSIFLLEGKLIYGGILVFFGGLVLVWLSGTETFNKILALVLPGVIFMSVYTITRDNRVREPAVWLIPAGYTGPLYVFLEEQCGEGEKREGEKRVYQMDPSGRMASKCKANPGLIITPAEYYYTDSTGYRVHLQDLRTYGDTMQLKPVWRDSTGQPVFAYTGEAVKGRIGETKIILEYAFVGTYRDYLDFVQTSPLPDSLDSSLESVALEFRARCE